MQEKPHILVVDDDRRLRELLQKFLLDQGFAVTVARDAEDARSRLMTFQFDALILDIMMPGESGLELTEALRENNHVPILLLSAKGEAEDRILGLEKGADDYLPKPFEPRELVARLRSILRRREQPSGVISGLFNFGSFTFDLAKNELRQEDELIRLAPGEVTLLSTFAQRPGDPISRDELSDMVGTPGNLRSIDVQVARLRRKIEDDPRFPRYLQTVRGIGYVLLAN
jgi:two-component system, OmpR family, phosphate regulon response regulator OmpR